MAINLAGAIGMTGKRESVISDLPAYIKDTGDYLAARNEQRRKEEAQKKAQEQEYLNNEYEQFGKSVNANLGSINQHWNDEYEKYAQSEIGKAQSAYSNPNLTLNQKKNALKDAHYNIAKAKSIYNNAEKEAEVVNAHINDERYASQEAKDFIEGKRFPKVTNELENTQPVEFMGEKPATAPMEGATGEETNKQTITYGKAVADMNHEELAKEFPQGLLKAVSPYIKLQDTDIPSVAKEALPTKPDYFRIDKVTDANGVQHATEVMDKDAMIADAELMASNIKSKTGKEASRMYWRLHHDAYLESKKNNIVDEGEREAFMNDYINEHANQMGKLYVQSELQKQVNQNRTLDKNPNQGGTTNNFYYGSTKTPTNRPEAKDEFKIVDTENKKKVEDSKATIVDLTGKKAEAVAQLKLEQSKPDGGNATRINMLKGEISRYDEALNSTNAEFNSAKNNTELQLDSFISTPATGETKISFKDGNRVVKDANFVKAGWKGNKAYMVYNIETGDKDNKVSHQKYVEITPSVLNDLDDVKFPDGFSLRKAIEKTKPKQATPTKKEAPKKEEAKKVDLRKKYNY